MGISMSISMSIHSPCSNHPRRIIAATCTSASNPLPILCFRCTPSLCHLSLSVRARAPIPSSPRAGCVAQLRLVAAASGRCCVLHQPWPRLHCFCYYYPRPPSPADAWRWEGYATAWSVALGLVSYPLRCACSFFFSFSLLC